MLKLFSALLFCSFSFCACGDGNKQLGESSDQDLESDQHLNINDPFAVDLDDENVRSKILDIAEDLDLIQMRGREGEEIAYLPNNDSPYSGWAYSPDWIGYYKQGRLHGCHITWLHNHKYKGSKLKEARYTNGVSNGETTFWHDNGQKQAEVSYENGIQHGIATTWYKGGQKESEAGFKAGKQEGLRTDWYENGQKYYEVTFKDGKRQGVYTSWYENGQKSVELTFKDDKEDGLLREWHENGEKSLEISYKLGIRHGPSSFWDEQGSGVSKIQYFYGKADLEMIPISVSGNEIWIPVPDGMVRIDGLSEPLDKAIDEMARSANNKVYAIFGTPEDEILIEKGKMPVLSKTVTVQHKPQRSANTSSAEFKRMTDAFARDGLDSDGRVAQLFKEMGKAAGSAATSLSGLKTEIKYDKVMGSGVFHKGKNFLCHTVTAHMSSNSSENAVGVIQVTSVAVMLIQGQVISMYASSTYANDDPLGWTRKKCREFVKHALDTKNQPWQVVSIPKICKFEIPPTVEVQNAFYKKFTRSNLDDGVKKYIDILADKADRVVIQQKGLNSINRESYSRYCRIIVETVRGKRGQFLNIDEPLDISPEELKQIDVEIRQETQEESNRSQSTPIKMKLLNWTPMKVVRLGKIEAFKISYTRSVNGAAPVLVNKYIIQNDDVVHDVYLSYRLSEKDMWEKDFDRVIKSFKFEKR